GDVRLLAQSGRDRHRIARRLAMDGRSRRARCRRLPHAQGPLEGPGDQRWHQHLSARGRGGAAHASGCRRGLGHRRARCALGRAGRRLRPPQAGLLGGRGGARRALPRDDRALQAAAALFLRRCAAEEQQRQGAEDRTAQAPRAARPVAGRRLKRRSGAAATALARFAPNRDNTCIASSATPLPEHPMSSNAAEVDRARKVLVGGVSSAVRAFRAVGGTPRFIARAEGAYLWDVEGRRYIDYLGSWGPMIVGHGHPQVLERVQRAVVDGLSYGAPNRMETELAERIVALYPHVEKVRFTSSGTEATMSAIRLARGHILRDGIIKFEASYHRNVASPLVTAGSGALAFGTPSSAGVPADLARHTLVAQFNELDTVAALFEAHPGEIACIIVEPMPGNMNLIRPAPGFLQGLRALCDEHGALLIFDEVMSGIRVALGGAQSLVGVVPDISTFGKVIGGGMPVGALGGPADVMDKLAPLGPVYQAGTLSGNPIAMAAGLATL